MNNLIEFAKNNRRTTFFRDLAITEIKLAYRCMEYLAPDGHFPSNVEKKTTVLLENGLFEDAAREIFNESDAYCSSSCYSETLREQTVELLKYLYPLRQQELANSKEAKRQRLLTELAALEG